MGFGVPTVSSVTVSLSISPQQVTAGSQISVQATANGGTAPYSFSYSGLPSECGSPSQPSFSCTPTASGTYNVQVTATDFHGNQSAPSNTVTLDVTGSSNNNNNNNNGNGNGGSNNSNNPFSSLLSGFGGFLAIAVILAIVGFVTWVLLVVGIWVIAVVLMRRLPKRGAADATSNSVKCASCSALITSGAKFCPECGASTVPKAR